jgi:hypothetical protein
VNRVLVTPELTLATCVQVTRSGLDAMLKYVEFVVHDWTVWAM